ncbi:M15 family metallopeptidase [Streptomyces sp. NPDC059900]|uniref:M15 family metallopeptidase n=1 Tax=Streptomyces sp. NPDC059900 TaxID=3155816 RepID=UPI00343E89C6
MNRLPQAASTTPRRARRPLVVGLVVVLAAITAFLGYRVAESSSSSAAAAASSALRGDHRGGLGEADGVVPDGVTVFDDTTPAVAELDPDLLKALRRAATAAADDGIKVYVNSGWRSPEYQQQLFREAVSRYGSEDEAARWVASPKTSPHVSGDAIDAGRSDATRWLSEHGAGYGLCQIYENEPWHYELRTEAITGHCPRMYADATRDPRMQ